MLPSIARVSIDEHVAAATADVEEPVERDAIRAAARLLEPLRKVQVAFDQMVRNVEDDLRARRTLGLGPGLSKMGREYIEAEFAVVGRHLAVLDAAQEAGHAMVEAMADRMRKADPDHTPRIEGVGPPKPRSLRSQVSSLTAELADTKAQLDATKSQLTETVEQLAAANAQIAVFTKPPVVTEPPPIPDPGPLPPVDDAGAGPVPSAVDVTPRKKSR